MISVTLVTLDRVFHDRDSVSAALKKGRFWITPDPYHNDDNIQIGREVKISCQVKSPTSALRGHASPLTLAVAQVEATPPEELTFSWLKNGRALRSSERMVITQTDPDISPGTTNLDIIDLKFTDFGTYTCVAALKGGGIPEISIDVNISSTTGESHPPRVTGTFTPPPRNTGRTLEEIELL